MRLDELAALPVGVLVRRRRAPQLRVDLLGDPLVGLERPGRRVLARLTRRAEEEQRTDDTPEVIARRLALYHEQTEPLVEHYRSSGKVVGIHAERSIDAVFAEIQETLEQVAARA